MRSLYHFKGGALPHDEGGSGPASGVEASGVAGIAVVSGPSGRLAVGWSLDRDLCRRVLALVVSAEAVGCGVLGGGLVSTLGCLARQTMRASSSPRRGCGGLARGLGSGPGRSPPSPSWTLETSWRAWPLKALVQPQPHWRRLGLRLGLGLWRWRGRPGHGLAASMSGAPNSALLLESLDDVQLQPSKGLAQAAGVHQKRSDARNFAISWKSWGRTSGKGSSRRPYAASTLAFFGAMAAGNEGSTDV